MLLDGKERNLDEFLVKNVPTSIHYIPDFITRNEEEQILKNVLEAPKPKWTVLSNRRLQDYGGIPHEKGMFPEEIPAWLKTFVNRVASTNVFGEKLPNHVLVNEYTPGQGIMPHEDGPLFSPIITTISCGSTAVKKFIRKNNTEEVYKFLLEPRSLFIVQNEMYHDFLHAIDEVISDEINKELVNYEMIKDRYPRKKLDRGTRISLTIRNVPKVLKAKFIH